MAADPPVCPLCDGALTPGVVVGRSPGVKFKPTRGLLGDLTGTPVTHGFFSQSADALRCEACGTVVVPGGG